MTDYTRPNVLPVWAESGDVVQPTSPEIGAGWPLTNVPPSRQRFNWILNWIANGVRYLLQVGVSAWDSGETYRIGSRVQHSGLTYVALTANTNKNPSTAATDWERWGYSATQLTTAIRAHQFRGNTFTATAGQTVFTVDYTPGAVMVFRKGDLVSATATNGTSVTLDVAATAGDIVRVISL